MIKVTLIKCLRSVQFCKTATFSSSAPLWIDFRAIFDSVNRRFLWGLLEFDGTLAKLLGIAMAYYTAAIKHVRKYDE